MPITRGKSQLPPFTRLVHLGIAVAFLVAIFTGGRQLDWHTGAGLTLTVLLLIWIVLMGFGLTVRRGDKPSIGTRLLWLAMLVLLLLTAGAGIAVYGFGYGAGPLASVMAGNPELGALAVRSHRPLALAALILVAVHTFSAGFGKLRERRQRLRR